jgi:hypothetical protein
MGKTMKTSQSSEVNDTTILTEWNHVEHPQRDLEPKTTSRHDPSSARLQASKSMPGGDSGEWAFPLESFVLDNKNNDVPVNFLQVYSVILRKFPGPPCEALAKAITYFQAVLTHSPAFHPYITHLPFNSVPTNETTGRYVAETLERHLIRVLQTILPLFNGDVGFIQQFISTCPAQLIPPPKFVVFANTSEQSAARRKMTHGVDGYNNGVENGESLWQSPVARSPVQQQMELEAVQQNVRKCIQMINRRRQPALPVQPSGAPQRQLPPPRPLSINFQSPPASAVSFAPPVQPPPQQFPPMQHQFQPPLVGLLPPTRPQVIAVAPPRVMQPMHNTYALNQAPVTVPQLNNVGCATPPNSQPTVGSAENKSAGTGLPPGHPLKEDISRLEAQMARILELVDRGSKASLSDA